MTRSAPGGRLLLAAALLLYAAGTLRVGLRKAPLFGAWDVAMVRHLHELSGPRGRLLFAPVIPTATLWGSVLVYAAVAHARGERRRAAAVVAALLLVWGTYTATKLLTTLPRPYLMLRVTEVPRVRPFASYPSGHAALAGILAVALARTPRGMVLGAALLLYVMSSRVALAVHHPSDVLAGALLGASLTAALLAAVPARATANVGGVARDPST